MPSELTAKAVRTPSVDMLRGLAVMGMIVVNAAAGLSGAHGVPDALLHAPWAGFRLADLMFPAFITIVGMSIMLAPRPGTADILARSGRLLLIGLLLTNMHWLADWSQVPRLPGVLQRIAIVYALAAFLAPRLAPRARLGLIAALLLGHWLLLMLPMPDGTATDLSAPGQDFGSWLDRALLAPFIYVKGPLGFDPEGIAGTLPALAQALIGTLAAERLRRAGAAKALALAGLGMIAGGLLWSLWLPIVKALWSGSFVLLSSGITLAIAGLLHRRFDPGPTRNLATVFGRNAMAAYVLHELAAPILSWDSLTFPYRLLPPTAATLATITLFVGLVALPLIAMDRRGVYLRV